MLEDGVFSTKKISSSSLKLRSWCRIYWENIRVRLHDQKRASLQRPENLCKTAPLTRDETSPELCKRPVLAPNIICFVFLKWNPSGWRTHWIKQFRVIVLVSGWQSWLYWDEIYISVCYFRSSEFRDLGTSWVSSTIMNSRGCYRTRFGSDTSRRSD